MYWVLLWEIGAAMKFSPQDFEVKLIRIKIVKELKVEKTLHLCDKNWEKFIWDWYLCDIEI